MNSYKGAWTFHEIQQDDFVSFLYGARAHNLYRVTRRTTYVDAVSLPPWAPLTFGESGRTYCFPFRLDLEPVRLFTEPLVRAEFAYVAENLLLRAGYAKTHFQADQTTLQSVSQMGEVATGHNTAPLQFTAETCEPRFVFARKDAELPCLIPFDELILQAAIRIGLGDPRRLSDFLSGIKISGLDTTDVEILGEKALSYGHIDLLIKESVPIGRASKVAIEVKLRKASESDVAQIKQYAEELGPECLGAALVAESFQKKAIRAAEANGIRLVKYRLDLPVGTPSTFDSIVNNLSFSYL